MLGQILSHLHMITAETYLMFEVFYSCEESIFEKKSGTYHVSLVLPRNAIMLCYLIIQFLLYYLSSGCLQEVEDKRIFQTFLL